MTLSKKEKINRALNLTQNDINKMPIDELYKNVKVLVNEANRRRKYILNNESMENNPLRTKQEERGRYTIPNIKKDTYIRQKLNKSFMEAYNLLNNPISSITGWKKAQTELRQRFFKKFDPLPDTDTNRFSEEARQLKMDLRRMSNKRISEFWDLFDKISEDPDVMKYVQGLDTNTLAQDVFDIFVQSGFEDIEKKITHLHNKLVGSNERETGILQKQYFEKQRNRNSL